MLIYSLKVKYLKYMIRKCNDDNDDLRKAKLLYYQSLLARMIQSKL